MSGVDLLSSSKHSMKAERRARRKPGKRKQTTKRKHDLECSLASTLLSATPGRSTRVPRGEEEQLLHAVDIGDFPTVKQILAANPYFNVNCTDLLGRTPMRLAVENEHLEIVQMLLEKTEPKPLYDALLLAITLDHDEIALTILRHPIYEKIERSGIYLHFDGLASTNKDESLFSAETTPLSLAAQRNRYEIVSLLVQKGQRIEEPHDQNCECPPCKQRTAVDELRFARSRLNAYKGLASEAYISLSSDDPILMAFEMRRKLIRTAAKEKHYREEYADLGKKLSDYVVKLLDNVRGNQELDVILNEEGVDDESSIFNQPGHIASLARLKLAVKYDEKGFVAHPSCQKKLTTLWYGVFQTYRTRLPDHWRWLSYVILIFAFPFLTIAYWVAPHSKVLDILRNPFVKFTGQTASFCVFLTLIITFSFMEKPSPDAVNFIDITLNYANLSMPDNLFTSFLKNNQIGLRSLALRDSTPDITQIIVCIFIVGLILQECKQLWSSGFKDHFGSLFNIIDFLSLALYVVSFTLRYFCFYKTDSSIRYFRQPGNVEALYRQEEEAWIALYWLIADRYYWDSFDPMNICEGFFAIANVLSFSRLFYLLAANEKLGPLQVSIRRMLVDLVKFFMILCIIMAAFMVALNNLYWYYDTSVRKLVELESHLNDPINAEEAFGTIESTFQTVYWALFGMGESNVVELGDSYSHEFTERVGYIVYGAYNFAAVTVLLNMLIAMMARSFDTIQNDESTEWKFARAQLYLDVMQDESFLPVPFNLLPSPISIFRFFRDIIRGCRKGALKAKQGATTIHQTIHKGIKSGTDSDDDNGSQGGSGGDGGDFSTSPSSSPCKHGSPEHQNNNAISGEFINTAYQGTLPDRDNRALVNNIELNVLSPIEKMAQEKKIMVDIQDPSSAPPDGNGRVFNKKSHRVKEYKEPKVEEPVYKDVIKRIVKRYIFESQKVESSPLEGDIEELKQDLSSFRYEVINALDQQRRALQESVNSVSAKLDIYSNGSPHRKRSHSSGVTARAPPKESILKAGGRSTAGRQKSNEISVPPEDVEEEIVPQHWNYGHGTPAQMQPFTKSHRQRSATVTSQTSRISEEDYSEESVSSFYDSGDDSIDVDKVMNLSAYKCIECVQKADNKQFKDKPYNRDDLNHLIELLNQLPVVDYLFDGGHVSADGSSLHDVIPVGYRDSPVLQGSSGGSSENYETYSESTRSAYDDEDDEGDDRSDVGPCDSISEYSGSDYDLPDSRRLHYRPRIVDPHLLYPPHPVEHRRRSISPHSKSAQKQSRPQGRRYRSNNVQSPQMRGIPDPYDQPHSNLSLPSTDQYQQPPHQRAHKRLSRTDQEVLIRPSMSQHGALRRYPSNTYDDIDRHHTPRGHPAAQTQGPTSGPPSGYSPPQDEISFIDSELPHARF